MKDTQAQEDSSRLDDVLRDLELQFADKKSKTSYTFFDKKKVRSFFSSLTQNQIIGGLTLVLLLVGAAVGVFLGEQPQEIRRQAAEPPYDTPTPTPDVSELCPASLVNAPCKEICLLQAGSYLFCKLSWNESPIDVLQYCAAKRSCFDPDCPGQPANSYCFGSNGCNVSGTIPTAGGCELLGGVSCCPGTPALCAVSPPTAEACYANAVGSRCTGFNGTCVQTGNENGGIFARCACVADAALTRSPTPTTVTQPTGEPTTPPSNTQPPGQPTSTRQPTPTATGVNTPTPTEVVQLPTATYTPRPTNTSIPTTPGQPTNTAVPLPTNTATNTPRPTNTSVPTTPGQPTNTPEPLPTETATPTLIALVDPTNTATPMPTNTSVPTTPGQPTNTAVPLPTNTATSHPQPTQTRSVNQTANLPKAGNANSNTAFILGGISVAVLIGAVALLFFL